VLWKDHCKKDVFLTCPHCLQPFFFVHLFHPFILINTGKDEDTAKHIYDGTSSQGLRCAAKFDTATFSPGKPIMATIEQLKRESHRTVLELTKNSLESKWIGSEIILALEQSQQRTDQDLALRLLLVNTGEKKRIS